MASHAADGDVVSLISRGLVAFPDLSRHCTSSTVAVDLSNNAIASCGRLPDTVRTLTMQVRHCTLLYCRASVLAQQLACASLARVLVA
jgi:hypothetical protein